MKLAIIFLFLFFSSNAFAIKKVKTHPLVYQSTTSGEKTAIQPSGDKKTFHATGYVATGTGESTIGIDVSNDGDNYIEVDELSLTLTTSVSSDYYTNTDAWKYVRANVKTLVGSGAQVTVTIGTDQ